MSHPADISNSRQGLILTELAGLGMRIARDLEARAGAAETNDEAVKLAGAFHRVARAVRQTLALEMRLAREEQALLRDFAPVMEKRRKEQVARRRNDLRITLEDAAWEELRDREVFEDVREHLGDILDEEQTLTTFLDEPFEAHVARLMRRLGLGEDPGDDAAEPDGPPQGELFPDAPPTDPAADPADDPDAFDDDDEDDDGFDEDNPWGLRDPDPADTS